MEFTLTSFGSFAVGLGTSVVAWFFVAHALAPTVRITFSKRAGRSGVIELQRVSIANRGWRHAYDATVTLQLRCRSRVPLSNWAVYDIPIQRVGGKTSFRIPWLRARHFRSSEAIVFSLDAAIEETLSKYNILDNPDAPLDEDRAVFNFIVICSAVDGFSGSKRYFSKSFVGGIGALRAVFK